MAITYRTADEAAEYIAGKVQRYWADFAEVLGHSYMPAMPAIDYICKPVRYSGMCYYGQYRIEYNLAYVMGLKDISQYDETIAHELAHILVYKVYPRYKQAHGVEFRGIMQAIGFSGRTYHSYNVAAARYIAHEQSGKELSNDDLLKSLGF